VNVNDHIPVESLWATRGHYPLLLTVFHHHIVVDKKLRRNEKLYYVRIIGPVKSELFQQAFYN